RSRTAMNPLRSAERRGQTEIAELDCICKEKQISRVNIAVLQRNLLPLDLMLLHVKKVENIGDLAQIREKVFRDNRNSHLILINLQELEETAVRQLHGDD